MSQIDSAEQFSTDANAAAAGDIRSVESGIKALWDRVKRASETITQLRNEKRLLQSRVEQLEEEMIQIRAELSKVEQGGKGSGRSVDMKGALFANGEREIMMARVKALLAKLDAYL